MKKKSALKCSQLENRRQHQKRDESRMRLWNMIQELQIQDISTVDRSKSDDPMLVVITTKLNWVVYSQFHPLIIERSVSLATARKIGVLNTRTSYKLLETIATISVFNVFCGDVQLLIHLYRSIFLSCFESATKTNNNNFPFFYKRKYFLNMLQTRETLK